MVVTGSPFLPSSPAPLLPYPLLPCPSPPRGVTLGEEGYIGEERGRGGVKEGAGEEGGEEEGEGRRS